MNSLYSILVMKSYFRTETRYTYCRMRWYRESTTKLTQPQCTTLRANACIGDDIAVGCEHFCCSMYTHTYMYRRFAADIHLPLSSLHLVQVDKYQPQRFCLMQRHHILFWRSHITSLVIRDVIRFSTRVCESETWRDIGVNDRCKLYE